MSQLDPYAVLGVARTATRAEIGRAYRMLAKRHHPDAGAPPSPAMARINEAWHILSDPTRRARWDRDHSVVRPVEWTAPPTNVPRRPAPPRAPEQRSARDSGWLAITVVAAAGVLIAGAMIAIALLPGAAPREAPGVAFDDELLSFRHPETWIVTGGEDDGGAHRLLAHVVTFGVEPNQLCTSFEGPCTLTGRDIPPGEASILFTAWGAGTPPVEEPVVARPFGLDADRIIGGEPAVFRLERHGDRALAWWQLSPPGFPDRWIEVEAEISGRVLEQDRMLEEIEGLLQTVEFALPDGSES